MTKIVVFRQTRNSASIDHVLALLAAAGIPCAEDFGFSRSQVTVPTMADKVAARKALAAATVVKLTAKDKEEAAQVAGDAAASQALRDAYGQMKASIDAEAAAMAQDDKAADQERAHGGRSVTRVRPV